MKTTALIFTSLAILGIAAAIFGNLGHLLFSTLPSTVIAIFSFVEYHKDKQRKSTLKNIQQ